MRCNPARFLSPAFAVVTTCALLAAAIVAQAASPPTPVEIHAQARDAAPESRMEGSQALDGAVAAALIGAISIQFGERHVAVKLDWVVVQPASLRDRNVSGEGRLRIGNDPATDGEQWIGFRFAALYDTRTASVSYPALVIGDPAAAEPMAADSVVARSLGSQVDAALASEFARQPARMVIDRVTAVAAGPHYLRVAAFGTADFAAEGTAAAQVEALYDRRNGQWLHLTYELGPTANRTDRDEVAVAIR